MTLGMGMYNKHASGATHSGFQIVMDATMCTRGPCAAEQRGKGAGQTRGRAWGAKIRVAIIVGSVDSSEREGG